MEHLPQKLKDAIVDLDIHICHMEDYLHGNAGNDATELRGKLWPAVEREINELAYSNNRLKQALKDAGVMEHIVEGIANGGFEIQNGD